METSHDRRASLLLVSRFGIIDGSGVSVTWGAVAGLALREVGWFSLRGAESCGLRSLLGMGWCCC